MNSGLDKIIGHIKEESEREVKALTEKAASEASRIKAEAEEKLNAELSRIEKKAEDEVSGVLERGNSSAELKKKQILLKKKQEIINETIAKAEEKLCGLSDAEYFEVIEKLFNKHALAREGEISFNKKDTVRLPGGFIEKLKRVAEEKGGSIKLSDETPDIKGGFILYYGGIEENCSFRALIDDEIEDLQDKVQKVLFS